MVSISSDRRAPSATFEQFVTVGLTEELRAELVDLRLRCALLELERASLLEQRDVLAADRRSASRS